MKTLLSLKVINMNTFSIHRFRLTLLWQLASRQRIYLYGAAIGLLAVVVPTLFRLLSGNLSILVESVAMGSLSGTLLAVLSAYLLTCGAFIVGNIGDKHSRISTFLLPASNLEKFLSRYLCVLIALPLAVLIGVAVGDLIQSLLCLIVLGDFSSVMASFCNNSVGSVSFDLRVALSLWLVHTIYLVVGTCFRRHAWIKTNLLLLAAVIVLGMGGVYFAKSILDVIYGENGYNIVVFDSLWIDLLGYLVMLALICFNYWVAFRLYARMQGINNKWYNI